MSRKKEQAPPEHTPYFDEEGIFHPRIVTSALRRDVQLSALSLQIIDLLRRFETSCQMDCCGFSALSFKLPTEWDRRWNFQRAAMKAIQFEIEQAQGIKAAVLRIPELRARIYKEDWLMLLEFLAENTEKSKQLTQFSSPPLSTQAED